MSDHIQVRKIQRNLFNFFGFRHPGSQEIYIVLAPTARELGLTSTYFNVLLDRPGMEDVKEGVERLTFHPSEFEPFQDDMAQTRSGRGGARQQKYSCLPLPDLEVLLNQINTNKVKNPKAKDSLILFRTEVNQLIKKYYNEGGAINEKATPTQKKTLRQKLEESEAENGELREENGDLRSDMRELKGMMRIMVSSMTDMKEDIHTLREEVRDERINRVAAVMRENKERKAKWKYKNLTNCYEDHMDSNNLDYSSVKKKANRNFENKHSKS